MPDVQELVSLALVAAMFAASTHATGLAIVGILVLAFVLPVLTSK